MSFSPDPQVTGSQPSAGESGPGEIPHTPAPNPVLPTRSARLVVSQTSTRLPVVIPAEKRSESHRSTALKSFMARQFNKHVPRLHKRRLAWSIVGTVGLLSIIAGFIFAVPLNGGQQSSPMSRGTNNLLTNGQIATIAPHAGTPAGPQPSFTPGFSSAINSRLFSNSSPWNIPIGTNVQLDPNSSAMASELAGGLHVPSMFQFGMPIYVGTASDPTYHVQAPDTTFETYQPIHIPATAAPASGVDKWMFVYDKTKNLIFEMWEAHKDGNTWSANTGDVYSPTGDGVHQVDGSPQSGNGASYFGGVITDADMARGYINHALSLVTQYTASSWRYPMNASDGGKGNIPMGARVQLDPSVNCKTLPGASVGEKMMCQALETYGGYIRDTGGIELSMYFEGEDLNDPNRNPPNGSPGNAGRAGGVFGKVGLQEGRDITSIPWNKLRVLKAWNSFTALSDTPATHTPALESGAAPGVLNPLLRPAHSALDLPLIASLSIGETARRLPFLTTIATRSLRLLM